MVGKLLSDKEKNVDSGESGFRRTLGLFDGVAILVGITIGAGIYSTPTKIANYQPSFWFIIGLWVLAGIFVFLGGLIYAELGSRFPKTGGEYVYITKAFGPYAGFIFGWAQLFIVRTSPAAGLAIVIVNYVQHFVELTKWSQTALAIFVISLIGALNYVGIRPASIFQAISTIVKVGGLFVLVIVGLVLIQGQGPGLSQTMEVTEPMSPFGLFAATMMLVIFSYLGWDRVGYSAGEMKNPGRNIPVSIVIGLSIVISAYIGAVFLYHYALGMDGVRSSERVASDTATVLIGGTGASLIAVIVMISAAGSINGTMMTAPRVYYAMAKDGLFLPWFNYIHPQFRTPSKAIIAHVIWAIVILLIRSSNFENIVAGMTFAVLVFYVVTTLAYFKLRMQNLGEKDAFRIPWIVPAVYLIGLVVLIAIRGVFEWQKSLVDMAFVATGIPFVIYFCRKSTK